MKSFSEIPIIDISPLLEGGMPAPVLSDLKAAYGQTGFGYIVGHGIEADLIDAVFEASRRFHTRPLAEKMAVEVDRLHRGYIPINTSTDVTSTLAEVTKPNQSASFMVMREDAIADPAVYLSGPNQWPDMTGFRAVLDGLCGADVCLGCTSYAGDVGSRGFRCGRRDGRV
jgi:isopenicillin N synthase-like dioxygenase